MMISSLSGASTGASSQYIATLMARLAEQTSSETTASQTAGVAGAPAAAPPPPPPGPPPAAAGLETGDASAESLFSALVANDDADGDGLISADELAASPVGDLLSAQFDSIDTDGDGLISETELNAAEASSRSESAGAMPPPPPGGAAAHGESDTDSATNAVSSAYETLLQALSAAGDTGSTTATASDLARQFMDALKTLA